MATSKKPNDKLSKIDKRSASVAPGKKYSDMTPTEKRKWNANQARYDAELTKQRKTATKSSPETIKAADKKGSGKPKYKGVDESQRKATNKGQTIFGGSSRSNTKINAPIVKSIKQESTKSVTAKPTTPKVPVKPRGGRGGGGMRGGVGGSSRIFGSIK